MRSDRSIMIIMTAYVAAYWTRSVPAIGAEIIADYYIYSDSHSSNNLCPSDTIRDDALQQLTNACVGEAF